MIVAVTSANTTSENPGSTPRARTVWAPIPGFDGYEVSTGGDVRGVDRIVPASYGRERFVKGQVLKQMDRRGYRTVWLKGRPRSVHFLVMTTFVGPRPEGAVIRHLNDVRHDNRISNLAYGSPTDNGQDALRNSRYPHQERFTCPQGHLYDSTETNDRGYEVRRCRTCRNQSTSDRQRRALNATIGMREYAKQQGVSWKQIHAMIERGELKSRKVGSTRRIVRAELPE